MDLLPRNPLYQAIKPGIKQIIERHIEPGCFRLTKQKEIFISGKLRTDCHRAKESAIGISRHYPVRLVLLRTDKNHATLKFRLI